MADRYLLESGAPDGYLLEDGTGVLLLDAPFTDYTPTITDPAGLVDSIVVEHGVGHEPLATDPAGLVDTGTAALVVDADRLGIVDDVTWTPIQLEQTNHEPIGLVDNVVLDQTRTLTDPVGLVDDADVSEAALATNTDPAALTDIGATDQYYDGDILGLVDSTSPAAAADRTLTDPLGLTDTAAAVTDSPRTVTDPLGLIDSITIELSGTGTALFADPLGLVDPVTSTVTSERTSDDPLLLSDSITVTGIFDRTSTDPLGLDDSLELQTDETVTIVDLFGLTDSVTVSLTGPTFWEPDPVAYTKNPVAYVPVGPDDDPPW